MSSTTRPTLLLTRPNADSQRFAGLLPGWRAVISPIIGIRAVPYDQTVLRDAPGLVFTSIHAVTAAGPGRGRLALCVGGKTAKAAKAAGFTVQQGRDGTAEGLLPLIAAAGIPLIHPHGRHVARDLPVPGVVVYDQIAQPLNGGARALLAEDGVVVLPLFSARSARLLADEIGRAPVQPALLWPVAISPAVMEAWSWPQNGRYAGQSIAVTPDAAAMAGAIADLAPPEQ